MAHHPGWLRGGVSYASSVVVGVIVLSRSIDLSRLPSVLVRLVRCGFSVAGARARRPVVGLVNHGCSFRRQHMRDCKYQGLDLGLPPSHFDSRRSLFSLSTWCRFGGVWRVWWCVVALVAPSPNKARPCLCDCLGCGKDQEERLQIWEISKQKKILGLKLKAYAHDIRLLTPIMHLAHCIITVCTINSFGQPHLARTRAKCSFVGLDNEDDSQNKITNLPTVDRGDVKQGRERHHVVEDGTYTIITVIVSLSYRGWTTSTK
ncbi:hypothetical protein YC2023_114980 [Brassica napus]